MLKSRNNRTGKPVMIIYPGEHYATNEDFYIATVVGTCLAVCIFDVKVKVGGMVNFVVPGTAGTRGLLNEDIFRIGILNMEYLMGDLVKLGCDRHYMKAKIFGAGYIENSVVNTVSLTESNIKFVRDYFDFEKIEIEKSDLGGHLRRKIYFSPLSGAVFRRHLRNNDEYSEFITLEKEYVESEFHNRERSGKIFLFD
jgi:chemotaxis protein CheD